MEVSMVRRRRRYEDGENGGSKPEDYENDLKASKTWNQIVIYGYISTLDEHVFLIIYS